jgi:putative NADH-flavin reductase
MKITVFGASSPIGLEIVKQALYKEHSVVAFDRNTINTKFPDDKLLQTISASLFDETQLAKAIANSDAVIFALSPSSMESNNSRSIGVKKLVEVMSQKSVSRLIVISDASVIPSTDRGGLILHEALYLERGIELGDEYFLVKQTLATSTLEWTMICVDKLTTAAPNGNFSEAMDSHVEDLGSSTTGNVAIAALNAVIKNEFVKQTVLIKDK